MQRHFTDAIDTVTNCIKTRSSHPGDRAVKNIEKLILNVKNGLEYQNQLDSVLSDYSEEINYHVFSRHLLIGKTKFIDNNEKTFLQ